MITLKMAARNFTKLHFIYYSKFHASSLRVHEGHDDLHVHCLRIKRPFGLLTRLPSSEKSHLICLFIIGRKCYFKNFLATKNNFASAKINHDGKDEGAFVRQNQ